jgi:hypothetical protein
MVTRDSPFGHQLGRRMKKLSFGFYLCSIVAAGFFVEIMRWTNILPGLFGYMPIVDLFVGSISLYSIIVYFIFWKRSWSYIQDEHTAIKTRGVIWRLLVPVYSLYGLFQVVVGFAKNYNAFVERHRVNTEPLPLNPFILFYVNAMFTGLMTLSSRFLLNGNLHFFGLIIPQSFFVTRLIEIAAVTSGAFVVVSVLRAVNSLADVYNGQRPAG